MGKIINEKGNFIMKKLKRIVMMGIATIMAVSAMGVSAFAEEDLIVATVRNVDNELVEIRDSDIAEGSVSVKTADCTYVIGKATNIIMPRTVYTGTFTTTYIPEMKRVSADKQYEISYSVADGVKKYTPNLYSPASGYSSVVYNFYPDSDCRETVQTKVFCKESDTNPVTFYLRYDIYVSCINMSNNDRSYATIHNLGAGKTATGTCRITN